MNYSNSLRYEELEQTICKCPECNELHTYIAKIKQVFISGSLILCPVFKKADRTGKVELAQKHKACTICLSWAHQREDCKRLNHIFGEIGCGKNNPQVLKIGLMCGPIGTLLLTGSPIFGFYRATTLFLPNGSIIYANPGLPS